MKKEPWRIAVAALSVGFIVFLWIRKDIASLYAGLPPEALVPVIATTVAVSLSKVAALTGLILLVKWIAGKFR